jgi:hypothetical protein
MRLAFVFPIFLGQIVFAQVSASNLFIESPILVAKDLCVAFYLKLLPSSILPSLHFLLQPVISQYRHLSMEAHLMNLDVTGRLPLSDTLVDNADPVLTACANLFTCIISIAESGGLRMATSPQEIFDGTSESECANIIAFVGGGENVDQLCATAVIIEQATKNGTVVVENLTRMLSANDPFTPDYPSGGGYDLFVASIRGTFILNGNQERTDTNRVGNLLVSKIAADALVLTFDLCETSVGLAATIGFCAAEIGALVAQAVIDLMIAQIDFHDGSIDSAELEAAYENTVRLLGCSEGIVQQLMALAGSLGEVRQIVDRVEGAVEVVQQTVNRVEGAVADLQEDVNRLLCPFGTTGLDRISSGQGCDGVDQDCDGIVDECEEDQTPPEINLAVQRPTKPFRTINAAILFLEANIKVSDDCSDMFSDLNIELIVVNELACEATFSVSVTDLRCQITTTISLAIPVDLVAPVVTCGFFLPQDRFHVRDPSFDPLSDAIPPFPPIGDQLHIDSKAFDDDDLVNVELWYNIEVCSASESQVSLYLIPCILY